MVDAGATLVAATPVLCSGLFLGAAPEISRIIRERVVAGLQAAERGIEVPDEVPAHLSVEYIGDYVEYAIDAAQLLPTYALTALGALLIVPEHVGQHAASLAFLLVPLLLMCALRLLMRDPVTYVSKKYLAGRYTFVPAVGLVMNVASLALIIGIGIAG